MEYPFQLPFTDFPKDENDKWIVAEAQRSLEYLKSFSWVRSVDNARIMYAAPGIVVAVDVEIVPKARSADRSLWVFGGDLPNAYIVKDCAPDAISAISVYCELMEQWANAVINSLSLDDVFPVEAQPNRENAIELLSRIAFIRERILESL